MQCLVHCAERLTTPFACCCHYEAESPFDFVFCGLISSIGKGK
jgi:hypothetical protein